MGARTEVVGFHQFLANDAPGSADAALDAREMGIASYRLGRIAVEAVESGVISADEAAACMGLDNAAFRAVHRRLWLLGCDCRTCVWLRESHPDPYDSPEGGDGHG
jgi:hypothetical protein